MLEEIVNGLMNVDDLGIEKKYSGALNSYTSKIDVNDRAEFIDEIVKYTKYLVEKTKGYKISDEDAYSQASAILEQAYEKQYGFDGALKAAKSGKLRDVLSVISEANANNDVQNRKGYLFTQIDPKDPKATGQIVSDFKKLYGGAYSGQMQDDAVLAKNYAQLISYHYKQKQELKALIGK